MNKPFQLTIEWAIGAQKRVHDYPWFDSYIDADLDHLEPFDKCVPCRRNLQEYGFSEAEATPLAREWLPDIMPYDYTSAAGFPNGRRLTDDTIDWFARLVSRGQSAPSIVGPHADILDRFPYLGPPHPIALGQNRPDMHEGAIAAT